MSHGSHGTHASHPGEHGNFHPSQQGDHGRHGELGEHGDHGERGEHGEHGANGAHPSAVENAATEQQTRANEQIANETREKNQDATQNILDLFSQHQALDQRLREDGLPSQNSKRAEEKNERKERRKLIEEQEGLVTPEQKVAFWQMKNREDQVAITEGYCKKSLQPTMLTSKALLDNAWVITPEQANLLLKNPAYCDSVAVVDLRIPGQEGNTEWKIPDAYEFPLVDERSNPHTASLTEISVHDAVDPVKEAAWRQQITMEPWKSIVESPVVIIHCAASSSRTPTLAGAYIHYVAKARGQEVVILEGGFDAYKATVEVTDLEYRPERKWVPSQKL